MIACTHATAQRIANAEAPAVSLYGPGELRRVTCTPDAHSTRWILETTDGTRLRLSVKHTHSVQRSRCFEDLSCLIRGGIRVSVAA